MKKLFLLDAYALIYRAHFAFIKRPLINSKGMNTSCVQGFCNTLMDLISKEKPTHLAVGFDLSGGTFRNEMFPEYKANRQEQPEDITAGVPWIKKILEAWNIPILAVQNYEADDVIGTIAKKAEAEGFEVYMMTPDKDYGQVVSDKIFLYKPAAFGNDVEKWGVAEVCEKWGIKRVEQVIDMLGLQGDAVDNIPGVPGIGPKTAAALLEKFDSIEGVIANVGELTGKTQTQIQQFAEQALLSKKLATIELDVPIDFDAKAYEFEEPKVDELLEIFKELEFRSLSTKIATTYGKATKSESASGAGVQTNLFGEVVENPKVVYAPQVSIADKNITNTPHDYKLVTEGKELDDLIALLEKSPVISFDTETTGIDATSVDMVGMSFAIKKGEGYYVPVSKNFDEVKELLQKFRQIFENENIAKIGQNIKYDMLILANYGVALKGELLDTMICHYLLEVDKRHNMDYLAETYLNYTPVSIESLIGKKGKTQLTMRDVNLDKVKEYAVEDADITLQLKDSLFPLLDAGLKKLYDEIEAPLIKVLAEMEFEGINLDADFLNNYSVKLETDIRALEKKVYEAAGVREINLNAPGQIGEMLFVRMKIPYRWKKTKTGAFSTDEEILTELSYEHEIVKDILAYRGLQKLKSTYVDALPRMLNPRTGRIHSSFNQALTYTGRLSSQNPNLQNIPVRSEQGREVRKAFVPRDKDHVLISADYSQIELRLIAEIANEENMIEAFKNKLDIHSATASKVYGVPIDEVTKEQRYNAKTINFSIIYGAGAQNLSKQLGIKSSEARQLIDNYFQQYPGLKRYMEQTVANAREEGYVTTMMGRKRYLRDINSRNGLTRSNEERQAINTPIQGSAADLIKIAMININRELKTQGFATRMILQVHDELIFDAPRTEVEKVKPLITDLMQNAIPNLRVPIEVGIGEGENWLEAH